ncbi:PMR5 N-terminal domain [Sesbania bispinosa]|nr:PMR5 N-terminal domain [Sesbania bispinosa]
MKGMTWGLTSKGSPKVSSHPRPLSWIVVSVGVLAVFLTLASWIIVSYPIGSTVHGYFHGAESSKNSDLSLSPINGNFADLRADASLDLVDNKAPPDLQPSKVSSSVSSDSKTLNQVVEHTDTETNSQAPLSESASPKFTVTKEVNGLETSHAAASGSQEHVTSFGNGTDVINSSLPAQSNSQIDLASTAPIPVDGANSSIVTGNIRIEEPTSVASMNKSSILFTTSPSDSITAAVPASSDKPNNESYDSSVNSGCDLYHGNWIYDPQGPLYTNNSCPVLTQMQNCQGNGRPDKDYENWRWKPFQCDLPRFDPRKFLELMRGKTLAFIGDSVARNQMESMLCILWQIEEPENQGNRNMQRYYFKSTSVMIVRIWSSWLVKYNSEPFDFAPAGVKKLYLDAPDEKLMEFIPEFDVVVLSSGHWFVTQSVYILNNEIVGGQLWWPDKSRHMKINSVEAFGISVETIFTALVTHPNYTGLTILRSYSPDHYEGGAWNTGGSCTGKVKLLAPGKLVENRFLNAMHEQQITSFSRSIKKATNRAKMILMDITEAFQYRHDGHPGPYRNPDPNKITKRGPDGRPPPQDCLHWCMPGPVDTWNEIVLEIIKREYEGNRAS